MNWFEGFDGKAIVVTGASSGIGREAALAFGAAGARVALVARRREVLEEVGAEVRARGGQALPLPTDVTRREDVRAALDAARQAFGSVDVVVNNAGVLIPGPVAELPDHDLEAMLRVNLFGALHVMQEAVRIMRDQPDGCIVNVASLAGRRGYAPLGGYCATKFGLVGLTEALREELHGGSIHLGLVLPGIVETPMVERVADRADVQGLWPKALYLPPLWVVWAIFAVARLRLTELSVPPGTGTLEKLAALSPSAADALVRWAKGAFQWLASPPAAPTRR